MANETIRLNLEQVAAIHDKMVKEDVTLVEVGRTEMGRLKVQAVETTEKLRAFPLTTSKQTVEAPAL